MIHLMDGCMKLLKNLHLSKNYFGEKNIIIEHYYQEINYFTK